MRKHDNKKINYIRHYRKSINTKINTPTPSMKLKIILCALDYKANN